MEDNFMINLTHMEEKIKEAYEKSCRGDWSCLEDVEPLKWFGAFYTEHTIRESLLHNLINYCISTEKDVYVWFCKNYQQVLGSEYKIVSKKNDPHHHPDFWVEKDGNEIPVECKLDSFTAAALRQLQRYMDFYGASKGIAVGRKLVCELPENIDFIEHGIGVWKDD
jgi:hypothetical protein